MKFKVLKSDQRVTLAPAPANEHSRFVCRIDNGICRDCIVADTKAEVEAANHLAGLMPRAWLYANGLVQNDPLIVEVELDA